MKCRVILVSLYFLLGCAAPSQETRQIRCTDGGGHILYTGPYNEKSWDGYLVHVDESTRAFYPKGMCRPEPVKEVRRSLEPAPAASKSPEPVKEVSRSPQPVTAARKSPAPVKTLNKSPEPVKALSTSDGRAEALTKSSEERLPIAGTGNPAIAAERSGTSSEGLGLQAASWLATIPYGVVKVAYALGGGIVGGLTWAMTGGDTAAAKSVWMPSMTGDYIVQPQNLTGEKPLHFVGGSSEQLKS